MQRGILVAAELATGKRLWTSGSGLNGPVAYADRKVYLVAAPGEVVALADSTGRRLVCWERCGDQVARFARGGASTPLRRYVIFDGGQWRAGPLQGMLFFVTKNHRLLGVHLDGGRPQKIGGVTMPTGPPRRYETTSAPIVRLDLDDRYVYVSQRDGWFRILDFRSGMRLFAVRASPGGRGRAAWEFTPVVRTGDYLIVQPEGEVLVVRIPR